MSEPVFAPTPELLDAVVGEVRSRRRDRNAVAAASAVLAVVLVAFGSPHLPLSRSVRGLDVTGPGPRATAPGVVPGDVYQPPVASPAPTGVPDRGSRPMAASPSPETRATAAADPVGHDRSWIRVEYGGSVTKVACKDDPTDQRWQRFGEYCLLVEHTPPPIHGSSGAHLLACRVPPTGEPLTFPDSLELDVVVTNAGGDVWRWSEHHPGTGGQRVMQVPVGECVHWVVAWALVDSAGHAVPYGTYTMTLVPRAAELDGFRSSLQTSYQPK